MSAASVKTASVQDGHFDPGLCRAGDKNDDDIVHVRVRPPRLRLDKTFSRTTMPLPRTTANTVRQKHGSST